MAAQPRTAKGSRKGRAGHSATELKRKPRGTKFPRQSFSHSCQWRPVSRPGGTPQEISRGQVRASGRRPRNHPEVAPCPSGASKKWANGLSAPWWWFGPAVGLRTFRKRCALDATLRRARHQKLLRCPAGAWPILRVNRGLRPLARSCPRLISCGVPPGRGACLVCAHPDGKPLKRLIEYGVADIRLKPGANEMAVSRVGARGRSPLAERRRSFSHHPVPPTGCDL